MVDQYEYKEHFGVIRMLRERDTGPFGYFIMGHFEKDEDGYYIFSPTDGVRMTCKDLRTAAQKASELNIMFSANARW